MTGSRAAISTAIRTPPIIELALKYRLPAIYPWPEPATEKGGLIAFGADQAALHGQVAGYVAKILRGSKPADLPVAPPGREVFLGNTDRNRKSCA
jgi:putative tryptophan/tyrosine transport system substrate-binding protein